MRAGSVSQHVIRTEGGVRRPPGPLLAVASAFPPYGRPGKVTAVSPERRAVEALPPGLVPITPGPHRPGPFLLSGFAAGRESDPEPSCSRGSGNARPALAPDPHVPPALMLFPDASVETSRAHVASPDESVENIARRERRPALHGNAGLVTRVTGGPPQVRLRRYRRDLPLPARRAYGKAKVRP